MGLMLVGEEDRSLEHLQGFRSGKMEEWGCPLLRCRRGHLYVGVGKRDGVGIRVCWGEFIKFLLLISVI